MSNNTLKFPAFFKQLQAKDGETVLQLTVLPSEAPLAEAIELVGKHILITLDDPQETMDFDGPDLDDSPINATVINITPDDHRIAGGDVS